MEETNVVSNPINFKYEFCLDEQIDAPVYYRQELSTLRNAMEGDQVHIYINSNGGRADTCTAFVHAIDNCRGDVFTHLDGQAFSSAAIIFLRGHIPVVYQHSELMLHNYSAGFAGKGHEIETRVNHEKILNKNFVTDTSKHFLSDEEIVKLMEGKDYYFTFDEICERLENRQKLRAEEEKEYQEDNAIPSREDLMKLNKKDILNVFLGEENE